MPAPRISPLFSIAVFSAFPVFSAGVRRRVRRPAAAVLLAAACASAAAACGSSPAAQPSSAPAALPACHSPQAPVIPDAAGSLTQTDTGAYCLGVGQTLDVFLTAPSVPGPTALWSRIKVSDVSVLGYGNSGVMTPPVGVTPGVVVGRGRGVSTVSSTLPDGKRWTVTIVVS